MSDAQAPLRDEFVDSLLSDFLDESAQLLDRLNENLLHLDEWVRSLEDPTAVTCDADLMNEMFRAAHSLKGLSAMLGLGEINDLTHKVENVFDAARNGDLCLTCDAVELLFQAYDCLVGLIECLKEPGHETVEYEPVVVAMRDLLQNAGADRHQTSQADAERALETELQAVAAGMADSDFGMHEAATPTQAPSTPEPPIDHFHGVQDESEVPAKYLSIFIDETEMALDHLTETLLNVEAAGGAATKETLLIISHRIKGSAAAVGLNRAAKLAHCMEDLLQQLRDTGAPLTREMTDTLLQSTDALRLYVEGIKSGNPRSDRFNALVHELVAARQSVGRPPVAAPSPGDTAKVTEPSTAVPATPALENDESNRAVQADQQQTSPQGDWQSELKSQMPEGTGGFVGRAHFEPNLPLVGLKASLVCEKLARLGELTLCDPPQQGIEELDGLEMMQFGLVADCDAATVEQALMIAGVARVELARCGEPSLQSPRRTPQSAPSPSAAAPTPQSTGTDTPAARDATARSTPPAAARTPDGAANRTADANRPAETLRVDIERLDQLMNLAGQLVINKARFAQIGEGLKSLSSTNRTSHVLGNLSGLLNRITETFDGSGDSRLLQAELENIARQARRAQADLELLRGEVDRTVQARVHINGLFEAVHQLDRIADGIQKSVMDTRMVPIGPLFGRFRRVVRDLTRSNGKDIQLVIRGEKTELDKRMIDELGDPLIHMVRNSADHGIELPHVREAAGKPARGTITLDAFHRGNNIIIEIVDDGKGIDADKILAKALEKNLVSPADAEKLTPHQIYQLIWEPGFSTAEQITEVSGRGMGMDIVRSKIEDINGTVELDSTPGQGTRFTIKLPLTLAILPSLMAEIDGDVFALPIESVIEIVRVDAADLCTLHGMQSARVRGRVISVVHLDEVLDWNGNLARTFDADAQDGATLVVIGDESREIGLAVDRLLGEEDVVIKSMAENYRNVTGIAGASILGDGRVSLILDIAALIELSSRHAAVDAACEEHL